MYMKTRPGAKQYRDEFGVEVAWVAMLRCQRRDDGFESRVPRQ